MRLYHSTSRKAAGAILAGGFRDSCGYYLTDRLWCGVFLADRPLYRSEGTKGEILVCVEIPEDVALSYEWEDGQGIPKPYREFLIPAKVVNRYQPFEVMGG
jgi:hypothetical protein